MNLALERAIGTALALEGNRVAGVGSPSNFKPMRLPPHEVVPAGEVAHVEAAVVQIGSD